MENEPTIQFKMERFVQLTAARQSEQTAIVYRQALDLFARHILEKYAIKAESSHYTELETDQAKSYLNYLQMNRSIETEHLYTRALLAFMQNAFSWEELDDNYLALSQYFEENRRAKEYQIPLIPLEMVERVLDTAKFFPVPFGKDITDRDKAIIRRDKAFILLLAETGLRVSEICDLKRGDFSNERNTLKYGENNYPLTNSTTTAIKSYLSSRTPHDGNQNVTMLSELPLFIRHDKKAGKRILKLSRWTGANIVNFWVEKALNNDELEKLAESGSVISPHTFRHYFVLKTLQKSEDIKEAQRLARHTDRTTTRRYLAILEEQKKEEE